MSILRWLRTVTCIGTAAILAVGLVIGVDLHRPGDDVATSLDRASTGLVAEVELHLLGGNAKAAGATTLVGLDPQGATPLGREAHQYLADQAVALNNRAVQVTDLSQRLPMLAQARLDDPSNIVIGANWALAEYCVTADANSSDTGGLLPLLLAGEHQTKSSAYQDVIDAISNGGWRWNWSCDGS